MKKLEKLTSFKVKNNQELKGGWVGHWAKEGKRIQKIAGGIETYKKGPGILQTLD